MNIEKMKDWIKERGLASQVIELTGGSTDEIKINVAIQYVYDAHTMSKQDFKEKYFD